MDTMKDTKRQPATDAVIEERRLLAEAEESRVKPLVIYHGGGCTDGFGAAFAAWLKLGDSAEYLPMEYGRISTPADFDMKVSLAAKDNEVYILDFSFPREVMDALFKYAKRVVWLDHHKTAFEMWLGSMPQHGQYVLGGPNTIWLDANKSGALLAWEYFHPGTEVPRRLQHIDGAAHRAVISELLDRLKAAENERDALRTALEKIADWDSAWGPYPETNEAWRAMVIVTAREAVPRRGEEK